MVKNIKESDWKYLQKLKPIYTIGKGLRQNKPGSRIEIKK